MAVTNLLLLLASVCVVSIIYVAALIIYNVYFHPLARFPGPFWAKISEFYTYRSIVRKDRSMVLNELLEKYGSPVRVSPNELVFSDVKAYADIHGQSSQPCLKDPKMYSLLTATGASSLISTTDKVQHARLRRILTPGFSLREILQWEHLIADKVETLMRLVFAPGSHSEVVNVYDKIQEHHLDIVSQLSYGKSFDTLRGGSSASHRDVDLFLDVVPAISFFPAIKYLPIDSIKEGQEGLERLKKFSRDAIIEGMRGLEREDKHVQASFLQKLITAEDPETGTKLTLEELVENTIIFLVAGTDTTAVTTTYTMWECSRNPKIHTTLANEIRNAFPDPNVMPTYEEACKLPYLNAVIDESLRLYGPSNIFVPRVSPGRIIASHYVPKGAVVGTLPYATARNPEYFPEPEKYIPERWLNATLEMRDASRPFGYGPRNCIGRHLAEVGVYLTLTRLFQLYDIVVDPSMTEHMMRPRDRGVIQPWDAKLLIKISNASLATDPHIESSQKDLVKVNVFVKDKDVVSEEEIVPLVLSQ